MGILKSFSCPTGGMVTRKVKAVEKKAPELIPTTGSMLGKGIIFGMAGALVGGFLWKIIALSTGRMYGLIALVSAALAGVAFGLPTRGGSKQIRGIIGALLGLSSIALGYYFIYTSPMSLSAGGSFIPASLMSFWTFWRLIADPVDYLFLLVGVYEGAKLGSM